MLLRGRNAAVSAADKGTSWQPNTLQELQNLHWTTLVCPDSAFRYGNSFTLRVFRRRGRNSYMRNKSAENCCAALRWLKDEPIDVSGWQLSAFDSAVGIQRGLGPKPWIIACRGGKRSCLLNHNRHAVMLVRRNPSCSVFGLCVLMCGRAPHARSTHLRRHVGAC